MAVGFMVRVGDAGLHRRVKVRAAEEGQTMGAWVRAAIETQLAGKRAKGTRSTTSETKAVDTDRLPVAEAALDPAVRPCRKCGHPAERHRPACILMGCVCQRFAE